jgi:hypothetical protein
MTSAATLISMSDSGLELLTRRSSWREKPNAFKGRFDVSKVNRLLIFCIYESQSLDLSSKFVRISAINLTGRFCCAPFELSIARRQRYRERSVENWQ